MKENTIIDLLEQLVVEEGVISNIVERVDLFRISKSSPKSPQCYDPGILIIARGQKRFFMEEEIISYDALNYLVVTVPLPLECETTASPEEPMLGLRIRTDATFISEILLSIDESFKKVSSIPKGIYSEKIDESFLDACVRLLKAILSPADRNFLAPMIIKEIVYRVLMGKKGDALCAIASQNQHYFQIAHILDKIHESFNKKFDLNSLAQEAGMSISTFHQNFKAITDSSPLQYIKKIKLHKARALMMEKGLNTYEAAMQVGYESPSQFNREYKRLFGITPGKDVIHV